MMGKGNILLNFIKENIALHEIDEKFTLDTELFNSGIVDSFGLLEILMFIEEEFSVKIESYQVVENDSNTIKKIIDLVELYK